MYNIDVLNTTTIKYAQGVSDQITAGSNTAHFPDSVIDAFVSQIADRQSGLIQALSRTEYGIALLNGPAQTHPAQDLQTSMDQIIQGITAFDESLGAKAAEILGNEDRYNITENVPSADVRVMCSRPAHSEVEGMENPLPYAVIDYHHDTTIGATIYLGHETGHSIADDYQNEYGNTYRDNPEHMVETQAYFVQHVLYNALMDSDDPQIAQTASQYFAAETARNIFDTSLSLAAKDALDAIQSGEDIDPAAIFENRFGEDWTEIAGQYEYAGALFQDLKTLKDGDTPENEDEALNRVQRVYDRLHERPMAFLTTAGIVDALNGQSDVTKRQVSEMLLGRQGAIGISAVLARAGIERTEDMEATAGKVINNAESALNMATNTNETELAAVRTQQTASFSETSMR